MGRNLTVFFILAVVAVGSFSVYGEEKLNSLISPVPKVFGAKSQEDDFSSSWFPREFNSKNANSSLDISAKSAILVDYETGEVLFAKNPKNRQPVASTVKIMTALVALEKAELDDVFKVSKNATEVGENSMILSEGEKLTMEELLYGMMLVSGNDAAVTIAENISGSEDEFVEEMNKMVNNLGLSDTRFVNASGLDEDDKYQYSTTYDLAVISHYLWEKFPKIEDFTSTYHKYIEATESHKDFELYNDTNLLTTYPGVRGIKPGFTWEAGLCLVTYAENNGKRLLGVILGSENRRMEMKELLDFGFEKYDIVVEHPDLDY